MKCRRTRRYRSQIAASVIAVLLSLQVTAAPYLPASDATVLERLPPALLAVKALQPSPSTSPDKLEDALTRARHFVEVGQTYGDPRAYGYAQAALGRYWAIDPAPPSILIMRARILQFRHDFTQALVDLRAALGSDQFNPEAWLLVASIEEVQGNINAAKAACLKLLPIADPLVGTTCVASAAELSGHADRAEPLLAQALVDPSAASISERVWSWTTLAEMRTRAETGNAEAAFRQALALRPDDVYAKSAYADWMLDNDRAVDVRPVLGEVSQADALLLRAAIAAQRNADADAGVLSADLSARFAEARQRGDQTHQREWARFSLEVLHDGPRALELATRNFSNQREPADARVLLEAALAVGDSAPAKSVIDWIHQTGVKMPRLERLVSALTAKAAHG